MDTDIETILETVAQILNYKKWRYERKKFNTDEFLNIMSKIIAVTLKEEDKGETTEIIIKVASQLQYREVIEECFNREAYFYSKLLPSFKKNLKVSLGNLTPRCYYSESSDANRVIVLQDMRTQGFKRYARSLYLDQEHVAITLQAIGKLHSLSMIYHARNTFPTIQVLSPFLDDNSVHYAVQKNALKKYSCLFEGIPYEDDFNNLCRYLINEDFLKASVTKARLLIYVHGDLWKENILFKYWGTKPVDVCLLDFQITRLMCPAAELLFFLMNSTESSVRRRHYKSFVSTYYQTIQETLRSNGLDSEQIYSEDDLKQDLKLVFPACFSLLFMAFLLWLKIDNVESLILNTSLPNGGNVIAFKNIIERVFIDFKDFGIFNKGMKWGT